MCRYVEQLHLKTLTLIEQFIYGTVCRTASPNSFVTLFTFKNFLRQTYSFLCNSVFDVDMPCTWSLVRDCPTRADFVLDQSAHLFTFSLSANHNAGNDKFTLENIAVFSGFREIQF